MATRSFLNQMKEIHGRFALVAVDILGLFLGQESVRFIPTAWLDACAGPEVFDDELWQAYPDGPTWARGRCGGGVGADR